MSKQKIIALAAVAALALVGCASGGAAAPADSEPASSADTSVSGEAAVIKVAGTGVSFPHSYKEGDELIGFDTEVIAEAAQRAGYTVEFSTMDFPGLLGAVNSGKIDTTATNLTWTPERGDLYVFSAAYAFDGVGLAARANDDTVNDLDDLDGKTIATGSGTTNFAVVEAWIAESGLDIELRGYDTAQSALQDVLIERADANAGPRGSTVAQIEKQGLALKPIGELLSFEQTRFPFANTARGQQLAADISQALQEMHADGTLVELSDKYFTYDRTTADENYTTPDPTEVSIPAGSASSAQG